MRMITKTQAEGNQEVPVSDKIEVKIIMKVVEVPTTILLMIAGMKEITLEDTTDKVTMREVEAIAVLHIMDTEAAKETSETEGDQREVVIKISYWKPLVG